MLDGDPGLGKSLLALDLRARLSTGRPFPDDTPGPGPARSLILNAEDSEADTIRPRLQAMDADLDRIFVPHPDDSALGPPLRLPHQTTLLETVLSQTRPSLVVLDPIVAFLDPSVCDNSDRAVRRALGPLSRLAEKYQCAILLIRHLNKSGGGRSLYRGEGTIGYLGACRSGWLVARDPDCADFRVLAHVKNNLARCQPSLAYTVESDDGRAPRICWQGISPWTADELLALESGPGPAGALGRAVEFLRDYLAEGPKTSQQLWDAAQQLSLSERTLYRARKQLRVRIQRVGRGATHLNYWLLPDQRLPASAPGDPQDDLETWLSALRDRQPPSTPLDDL